MKDPAVTALVGFALGYIIATVTTVSAYWVLRRPTPCVQCDEREWERKNWG